MMFSGLALLSLSFAAVRTAAEECISARTAADILRVVRDTQGHALICLEGDSDRYVAREANNERKCRNQQRLVCPHGQPSIL